MLEAPFFVTFEVCNLDQINLLPWKWLEKESGGGCCTGLKKLEKFCKTVHMHFCYILAYKFVTQTRNSSSDSFYTAQ